MKKMTNQDIEKQIKEAFKEITYQVKLLKNLHSLAVLKLNRNDDDIEGDFDYSENGRIIKPISEDSKGGDL